MSGAPAAPAEPRRRRAFGIAWPVALSLVIFVLAWQAVVFVSGFQSFVLPGPWTVFERFVRAWADGTMWPHVAQTLLEILLGFAIGASVALVVGVLLARSRLAERLLSPYLVAAQATPVLALAPLIVLWFGNGLSCQARDHDPHRLLPRSPSRRWWASGPSTRGCSRWPAASGHRLAGRPPRRGAGHAAGDPRRHAGGRHARRDRRDRRRVGRRATASAS